METPNLFAEYRETAEDLLQAIQEILNQGQKPEDAVALIRELLKEEEEL